MPEGDSLRRLATRLQPLIGQALERVTTQGLVRDLAGRTVTNVDAHVRGGRSTYCVYLQHRCTRCGGAIAVQQLGEPPRLTWWCPRCQPTAAGC